MKIGLLGLGGQWVRNGPFEGDPAFTCFHFSTFFPFVVSSSKNVSSFSLFILFLPSIFLVGISIELYLVDVVGAPWRCGVLTT